MRIFVLVAALIVQAVGPCHVQASDWPMSRYDSQRTGASPTTLPKRLNLQWIRQYPSLKPAWPDQVMMQLDAAYDPVIAGTTLYLASPMQDSLRAVHTRTGAELWTFFADGPIRYAPVLHEGKAYFASDDGYLYCVDGTSGQLAWKFRGGPSDRKILGNDRLISTWPARGAPVIRDGVVYFGASIWPFMGIFLHAVDARTGNALWTNDGDGSLFLKQPHNTESFASVAPQGPLVAIENRLLVPGGRSIPALLDRTNGQFLRYQLAENGKKGGGAEVVAMGKYFFNGGGVFDRETQKYVGEVGKHLVVTPDWIFHYQQGALRVLDLAHAVAPPQEDPKAKAGSSSAKVTRWSIAEVASLPTSDVETQIVAGDRLIVGGQDRISIVRFDAKEAKLVLEQEIDIAGRVARLAVADDRVFVVTREGAVCCLGDGDGEAKYWAKAPAMTLRAPRKSAGAILPPIFDAIDAYDGYAIVWGTSLVSEILREPRFSWIIVDQDAKQIHRLRSQDDVQHVYGNRVHLLPGTVESIHLPPYLANLVVITDADSLGKKIDASDVAKIYESLRPFGGTACFMKGVSKDQLKKWVDEAKLVNARVFSEDSFVYLAREGALPGSANWTHEHADPANTRVSRDTRVKAPLGLLWFGGPSNEGILPRHGHGPQPQVIDGRLIIEGVDSIRATDIYTGRLLWETALPGVGKFFNNVLHQPGANASGGNFVSTSEGIYVAYDRVCVRLDPATGKKLDEIELPVLPGMKETPRWGYISISGDFLIAGAEPIFDAKNLPPEPRPGLGDDDEAKPKKNLVAPTKTTTRATGSIVSAIFEPGETTKSSSLGKFLKSYKSTNDNFSGSRFLVVMDRHTGQVLWSARANHFFRHNAICTAGDRLFAIDRLSGDQLARIKVRGKEPAEPSRLVAFDLRTGQVKWESKEEVFGTWLSVSVKHGILIESGRNARDTLLDEAKGMRAYQTETGKVLWFDKGYLGPAMIHGETVLQGNGGCDLFTGAIKMRDDPITGKPAPWVWQRTYGCNTPSASEYLLTFRSGAAGFFDLLGDGGTGNFGGFRSSCTNNLIVAGGVLTAPEYTRTCTCTYQNQTSVGLVHLPEVETWTYFGSKIASGRVRKVGLNLGAVGDRRDEARTLWMEWPSLAGTSPNLTIEMAPATPRIFRRHSSQAKGELPWVASSGLAGLKHLKVNLGRGGEEFPYAVRLVFLEPENVQLGQRRFEVRIQGKLVLDDFDIVREGGGNLRSVVREFQGIKVNETLEIRLDAESDSILKEPILCGVEIREIRTQNLMPPVSDSVKTRSNP